MLVYWGKISLPCVWALSHAACAIAWSVYADVENVYAKPGSFLHVWTFALTLSAHVCAKCLLIQAKGTVPCQIQLNTVQIGFDTIPIEVNGKPPVDFNGS